MGPVRRRPRESARIAVDAYIRAENRGNRDRLNAEDFGGNRSCTIVSHAETEAMRNAGSWADRLRVEDSESVTALRSCTYAGRPLASDEMVEALGKRLGRKWTPGRPRKMPAETAPRQDPAAQCTLF